MRDYARKCGFRSVVLGLSGGVDSAVSAAIAADAVGAENVLAVAMPSRYSSRGSLDDAAALARGPTRGLQARLSAGGSPPRLVMAEARSMGSRPWNQKAAPLPAVVACNLPAGRPPRAAPPS